MAAIIAYLITSRHMTQLLTVVQLAIVSALHATIPESE